jgi:hypothetical protein
MIPELAGERLRLIREYLNKCGAGALARERPVYLYRVLAQRNARSESPEEF